MATPSSVDTPATPPDKADLSATILLEEFKDNLRVSQNDSSPVLGDSNVSIRKDEVPIPDHIKRLTDEELRAKLVSLGEKPGPIISSTRQAYQSYLNKILTGIQPAGNSGYKCMYVCV